jgi:hypothetical protein
MKTIYILFFCLLTNLSIGQLSITNVSSSGQCDGSAYYYGQMDMYSGYSLLRKIVGLDTIFVQEGLKHFNNLCEGNYILESTSSDGWLGSVSKFSIKNNSESPCQRFSLASSTEEDINCFPDTPNSIRTVILTEQNGTPPFQYFYDNIPNGNFISTFDFGQHSVKVIDSLGCIDSMSIELKASNICRGYTAMNISSTPESVTNACDGLCELTPINITDSVFIANNIHIIWENGYEGFSQSNLCPGFHLVDLIIDTSLTQSCHSKMFIYVFDALDSVFVYGNYANQYSTLYSEWTDECSIDLTAIQSAEIIDFTFITPDSIVVTWEVRDTNQVVATIYAGYSIPNTSENYNFVLQLYCLQKSFPVYAHAVDQFYIGELSVSNSTLEGVSIAPNPAENILKVKSKVDFDTYLISDMCGKTVKSQDYSSEINIEDLQSGIYILHLRQDENVVLVKFVKK